MIGDAAMLRLHIAQQFQGRQIIELLLRMLSRRPAPGWTMLAAAVFYHFKQVVNTIEEFFRRG